MSEKQAMTLCEGLLALWREDKQNKILRDLINEVREYCPPEYHEPQRTRQLRLL